MFLAIDKYLFFYLNDVIRFRMQCIYHFRSKGVVKYFFKGDELTCSRILQHFI
jgi:hypothetical protein